MRRAAAFTIILLLAAAIHAQSSGFRGGWNLDAARSEGLPPSIDVSLVVEPAADGLRVHQTLVTDSADRITDDVYIADGTAHDFKPQLGGVTNATGKRTAKWSGENELDVTDHIEGISFGTPTTYDIERQWVLSADGATLTLRQAVTSFGSTTKSVRVFTRR